MAKKKDEPKPRKMTSSSNKAGVAWSCQRCGTTGLTADDAKAKSQFDAHRCSV